ncbi:ADP-heptose--LPS heptosyltransferase [Arenimonas maotaiensis]|uniref:ADP-heptose--LPS heptosyltransferase n=1 Tax=Arenimonas maotaiensis TaxID=1446479 RepID=A0A917FNT8_9GAMM|nr:ADP-heptose--LPS heptosyltransferase [Arenimonas maotaiensis]
MGDATHVLPLIRTLQRGLPGVAITWVLGKGEAKLMEGLDGVELIAFDKKAGLKGMRELAVRLAGRRFDVLLQMQLALRANLVSGVISAKRRIGYDVKRGKEGHGLFINERIRHDKHHVLDVFGLFAEPLGLHQDAVRWDMPVPQADRDWAAAQWPSGKPCLLVSPCSSHVLRNWRPERYAAVANHAIARGWQVVLCGGRSVLEREVGDAIAAAMPVKPIDLIGKDTLKQLLALLERAELVLTPDSGPAHMANAMGSAVLGLYACTDAERSGPYSDRRYTVNCYAEAAERFLGKHPEQLPWGKRVEFPGVMDLVTVEDVIARFERYCADRGLG